jgi:hypothetical protein
LKASARPGLSFALCASAESKRAAGRGGSGTIFCASIVQASLDIGKPFLSQHVIKALNFHAISCLHVNPANIVLAL